MKSLPWRLVTEGNRVEIIDCDGRIILVFRNASAHEREIAEYIVTSCNEGNNERMG